MEAERNYEVRFLINLSILYIFSSFINKSTNNVIYLKFDVKTLITSLLWVTVLNLVIFLTKKYYPVRNELTLIRNRRNLWSFLCISLIQFLIMIGYFNNMIKMKNPALIRTLLVAFTAIALLCSGNFRKELFSIHYREVRFILFITTLLGLTIIVPKIVWGSEHLNFSRLLTSYPIRVFIYPAFYEEVLYRLFCISALYYFKNADDFLGFNIIQAIIFGLAHVFVNVADFGYIAVIMASSQMMVGMLLGYIYLYSGGSLGACILLHGLLDIMAVLTM